MSLKVGIFYGSTMGNTENIAFRLQDILKIDKSNVHNIINTDPGKIREYDLVFLGASTWGIGDLQDDWVSFLPELGKIDLTNLKCALFGLGDQEGYPDSFVDAIGIIYKTIKKQNAEILGGTITDGYNFSSSAAQLIDKKEFVGLALDEDNQAELSDQRLKAWADHVLKSSI